MAECRRRFASFTRTCSSFRRSTARVLPNLVGHLALRCCLFSFRALLRTCTPRGVAHRGWECHALPRHEIDFLPLLSQPHVSLGPQPGPGSLCGDQPAPRPSRSGGARLNISAPIIDPSAALWFARGSGGTLCFALRWLGVVRMGHALRRRGTFHFGLMRVHTFWPCGWGCCTHSLTSGSVRLAAWPPCSPALHPILALSLPHFALSSLAPGWLGTSWRARRARPAWRVPLGAFVSAAARAAPPRSRMALSLRCAGVGPHGQAEGVATGPLAAVARPPLQSQASTADKRRRRRPTALTTNGQAAKGFAEEAENEQRTSARARPAERGRAGDRKSTKEHFNRRPPPCCHCHLLLPPFPQPLPVQPSTVIWETYHSLTSFLSSHPSSPVPHGQRQDAAKPLPQTPFTPPAGHLTFGQLTAPSPL